MTSLNKDSTFEREDLSEMLSAGQKTNKNQETGKASDKNENS